MRLALLVVLAGVCGFGQGKLAFEVASVKPSLESDLRGLSFDLSAGRFSARNMDLYNLISTAYGLRSIQTETFPGWTKSARFDIQAQAADPASTTDDQVRTMLQALLEDRFQLKFHRVTTEQSGYAVTADSRGLKLRPPGERSNGTLRLGNVESASINMETLITLLEFELGRPVVDRTGVTTDFAIRLEWASQKIPADAESSKPSLVTALREQLGLRLESARVPLEVFVIDRIERPSEN